MGASGVWEPGVVAVPGDVLGPAVGAGIGTSRGLFLILSLQIGLRFVDEVRTEWVLQHTRAQTAADGYASGTAELWDEDRRLVALAHQIAKIQPFAPTAT
jgi:acyl-CoA thioesterase